MANEFRVKNGLIVHDSTAVSGVTPNANADNIVVDASGDSGMTIFSGASSTGNIFFGDGGSATQGQILYAHSSNSMRLVTAGSERVRIDSSGNVGIGTTSPGVPLHVSKTLTGNDLTTLTGAEVFRVDSIDDGSSSNGPGFQIRLESTSDHNGANYEKAIVGDGGSQRVKNIFGNYGFHEYWLAGNADGKKPIAYLTADGSTSASGTQYGVFRLLSTATAWGANTFSPSGETTALELNAGGDSYFNGGNVGINTSSPQSLLDVRGAAGSPGTLTLSTAETTVVDGDKLGRIDFNAPSEADGTDAIKIGASIWAEADDTFASDNNETELVFATAASDTAAEQMRLTSDGKLGIGTPTPTRALDVNGDIRVRGNNILDNSGSSAITFDGSGNTTIDGTLTVSGSTATVNGSNILVAGAQTEITTDFSTSRKIGRDADNLIDFTTDNEITFRTSATDAAVLTQTKMLLHEDSTPRFELFTWENSETTDGTRVSMRAFHNSTASYGMVLKSEATVNTVAFSGQAPEYWTTNGSIHFEGHDDTYGFWKPITGGGGLFIGNSDSNTDTPQSQLEVRAPAGSPGTLTLSTFETTVVDGDKLGRIDFNAPKESDGGDAVAIAASIWAEADDTFASDNNSTDLVFATGASEAATEKMRLTHEGYLGIGDSTPVSELDLGTGALSFSTTNTQLKLSGGSNVDLQLGHWGNTHILIDTDGNDSSRYFSVRHGNATAGSATELFKVTEAGETSVTGNLTVSGNITVNGTTTTVDTATLSVEDPLIILASGNDAADTVDIGFYGLYDTTGSQDLYAGLFRDADDGKFHLFKDLQDAPTTTVSKTGTGYAVATLVANVEGNLTGTLQTAAQTNITSLGTLTSLTGGTGDLIWDTDTLFVDSSADRVGMGNSSPETTLHVSYNTNTTGPSGTAQLLVEPAATTGQDASIEVRGARNSSTTAVPTSIKFTNYDNDLTDTNILGAVVGQVTNHTTNVGSLKLQTSSDGSALSDRLTITSAGNVGIGVTDPSSILHVKEASTINSVANSARMIVSANGGDSYIHLMESTDGHNIRHTASDNSLRFRSTLAGSDLMTLQSGGNLGIGTTSPGHKLEVNGSFAATTKSFDIEHPTKEGMRLHHGSLEGPEHGVYHRGVGSSRVVDLPDYWTGLVDEDSITVQLTPKGQFQSLYVSKIEGNRVYVDSDHGEPLDFYFNVYGERKDVDKLVVEY